MYIEHIGILSSVLRKKGRLKHKNHAQDCGTLIVISVRRSCHGFHISDGVHPSE